MDKRTFIKNSLYAAAGLSLTPELLSCSTIKTQPKKQKNWVWVRPVTEWSVDDWKRKFDSFKAAGLDAVLAEVYNGNETFYEGGQLPMKANVMEKLIIAGQASSVEIHAWMWTMPCNAASIIEKHPDWYAYNGLGQPAHTYPAYVPYYKFLCPCHPEVREFVRKNVESLSRISELKGVHLDYVRLPDVILAEGLQPKYNIVQDKEYPEYDYSYSPECRRQFKAKTGVDPLTDLKDPSSYMDWVQFRRDSITGLVNGLLVPEAKKYGKEITAAVFPNWENVRQEWHKWNLDGFLPMLYHNFYNRDIDFVGEHVKKGLERLDHKKPLYAGLFVPALNPGQLADAIKVAREAGASGFSMFDMHSLTEEHLAVVTELRRH